MHPEHQRLLSALTDRRTRLLDDLARVDDATLRARPSPESWSLLQVAEHLELTERATLGLMQHPRARTLRRRPRNYLGYAALWLVMKTGVRVSVPAPVRKVVTPSGEGDLETLRERWAATAEALEAQYARWTDGDYQRFVGLHPIGGPLTPTGVLIFLRRHFDHHLRQVRRIGRQLSASPLRTSRSGSAGR